MAWLILGLGVVLGACGASALWSGISYMPVEWGWSQIIAGATAMTGSVVTVALAAVVHRLRAIETSILDASGPRTGRRGRDRDPGASAHVVPEAAMREDGLPPSQASDAADTPSLLVTPLPAAEGPGAEGGAGYRVGIGDVGLDRAAEDTSGAGPPSPPQGPDEQTEQQGLEPAEQQGREELTVVGRYEAGGASYALFSDGTIAVETETGTHRFGSMEELKAYLERQDRVAQAEGWPD